MSQEISVQEIQRSIYRLPERPHFMMTQDLARIYETEAKYVNRAVKRNKKRFPEDFCFQLSKKEVEFLRCQSGTAISTMLRTNPYGFTREGANMLSTVLHTNVAIDRSLQIMRAFTALENQVISATDSVSVVAIELLKELKKYLGDSNFITKQIQIMSSQMITFGQEVSKLNERVNILETKIEAVMKARGNFNENHWLFGKFTEIVAEGIDENRGKIESLEATVEKLTQQKSKRQQKNSKIEKT